jgi:hypothetical protein
MWLVAAVDAIFKENWAHVTLFSRKEIVNDRLFIYCLRALLLDIF